MNFKNKISYIFLILFSFITFLVLSKIYIDYFDINRHWTSQFDQELTFAYNALLFNSGIKHEFIDHSAYFTILFLSIFIKISQLLNIIEFHNLRTFFEQNNFDNSLQEVITLTRIYAGFSIAIWAVVVNILFLKISNSKIFSFFLTLIVFSMPGTIEHVSQLRTELMTSLFMILSLIMIISYFENKNLKFQNLYLLSFFIFLYSAILNKSQIFFYFPLIILFSIFFFKRLNQINFEFLKDLDKKKYITYFFLFIIFYLILKLLVYKGSIFSLFFIITNILILNITFYYLAKKSEINEVIYLNHLNLFLVASFIIFKSILFIHPSTNEMAFNQTFSDVMGALKYTSFSLENETQLNFLSIFSLIFKNFSASIMKYFSNVNFYSILIVLIISVNLIMRKILGLKKFLLNFICLLIPIVFTFIASFRMISNYYNILSDFIFLIPLCIFYKNLTNKFYSFLIIMLIPLIFFNYEYLNYKKNSLQYDNIKHLCFELKTKNGKNYLEAFQTKIPRQNFIEFCKNKNSF